MSYKSQSLSSALDISNVLASGQVIKFAEGAALSGIPNLALGDAVAFINPDTGTINTVIYAGDNPGIGFGASNQNSGLRLEFAGAQFSYYYGNTRIFYANNNGINLGEKRLDGFALNQGSYTTDSSINSQGTGAILDNNGAAGLVNLTLGGPGLSKGHIYWFYNVAGQPMRIIPNALDKFITPTGALPDGSYIELNDVGSCVNIATNAGGDWMILSQQGTINPQ